MAGCMFPKIRVENSHTDEHSTKDDIATFQES
jgi:hypothetical protein